MRYIQLFALGVLIVVSSCNMNNKTHKEESIYLSQKYTFPEGKTKVLILSYDDGLVQDKRMIETLDKYQINATFNLNSGKFGETADWLNDVVGKPGKYFLSDEVQAIYGNHEVASHTINHPHLYGLEESILLEEIRTDINTLESLVNYPVVSFAYPFGDANDIIAASVSKTKITNARTVSNTYSFEMPENLLLWNPTCHHNEANKFVDNFKAQNDSLALFYIWGHSWEFDKNIEYNNWKYFEDLCAKLSGDSNVWYVGAGEFANYLLAVKSLVVKNGEVINNSNTSVFLNFGGDLIKLIPHEKIKL